MPTSPLLDRHERKVPVSKPAGSESRRSLLCWPKLFPFLAEHGNQQHFTGGGDAEFTISGVRVVVGVAFLEEPRVRGELHLPFTHPVAEQE